MATTAPGWQTDELDEEWIEEERNDASLNSDPQLRHQNGTQVKHSYESPSPTYAAGTVIVRADVPLEDAPNTGRLPLAHRLGLVQKNIFSPLKLETMFNPPATSPNANSRVLGSPAAFRLDDEVPLTQRHKSPGLFRFNDGKSNRHYQFTFSQPPATTPAPPMLPESNSQLRLFQFQYDTYTRDHLSAIIDAIPVDNSASTPSDQSSHHRETDDSPAFRAPKRIKLSPPDNEISFNARYRPKRHSTPARRRDYGHVTSQSLMGAIQEIENYSHASTTNLRSGASSTVNASERSAMAGVEGLAAKMEQVTLSNANIRPQNQSFDHISDLTTQPARERKQEAIPHPPIVDLTSHGTAPTTKLPIAPSDPPDRQGKISRISSVASGVKHAGEPLSYKAITRIAPTDISPVPEQVGRMQFDRTALRWVKRPGEESDDPFRDIESIKEASSANSRASRHTFLPSGLTSTFESPQNIVDLTTGDEESDEEVMDPLPAKPLLEAAPIVQNQDNTTNVIPALISQAIPAATTPLTNRLAPKAVPTPIRSALKSGANMVTPVTTKVVQQSSSNKRATHPRSVSFSDGRKSGRIRGLHSEEPEEESSRSKASAPQFEERQSYQPSLRTKRIADMLDDLDGASGEEEDLTPCKVSSRQRSMVGSLLSNSSAVSQSRAGPSMFSVKSERAGRGIDATFLTECSFGVAHDRLLQCITDVQPFEPHWEELTNVNLSGKRLDSLARLKEFMPKLEDLVIDDNVVSWLSGIPQGVRTLSAVSNQLTGLTSYVHLPHLETLDISKNQVDSLLQLECLHRLKELKADHNEIHSLAGLSKLRKLHKLSLVGNCLTHAALGEQEWHELEYLDLSENKLSSVEGLEALANVTFVNLDHNEIERLDIAGPMPRLRCFRVSDNKLEGSLDVRWMGNVRILYADRNRLTGMVHGEKLRRLETLSLRYQSGRGLVVKAKDVRDVRRLYLSGNSLGDWFLDEPCYNLIYLELAHCELTRIGGDLGRVVPNLRVLNLNYNFIGDLEPVASLGRLRKLSMIGSRVRGTKAIIRAVGRLGELEMVDFRMNPCTVSWYVPVLDRSDGDWQELDAKFRRGLPDELYASRLVYRGQLIRSCERLKMVDGLRVGDGERTKANELLRRLGLGASS